MIKNNPDRTIRILYIANQFEDNGWNTCTELCLMSTQLHPTERIAVIHLDECVKLELLEWKIKIPDVSEPDSGKIRITKKGRMELLKLLSFDDLWELYGSHL